MSRRLLLAVGGPTFEIPDPLPGDGGGDPEPPGSIWEGWPTTTDPILLDLRPAGRRGGLATVTPASDINAAATAAKNAAQSLGSIGSGYWDGDGPDYRHDVLFGPGTYAGPMGGGAWGCYVGTSGNPADTILHADDGGNGTLHSFGSIYLENMTLKATSADADQSPKYPWHITGGPVTVAANCVFDTRGAVTGVSVGGGNRTQGLVGKDSSVYTVFYKCTFIATPGTASGFNMHGATGQQFAETCVFIDCETVGVTSLGSTGDLAPDGTKSRLYVINLTHDEHLSEITADVNTHVYTDTDLPVSGGSASTTRGIEDWPLPEDGLLDILHDYYYPSALGDEPTTQTIPVTDAAPMAPVPGRVYITRVRTEQAMRVTTSGVTITTAAGQVMIRHRPSDTPYVRNEGPEMGLLTPNVATTVGQNAWLHSYFYTRYPGDNGFWVRCAFDNAAVRVSGSSQLAGLTDCYYTDDGVTLVPVTSGTAHPLPFIRAT